MNKSGLMQRYEAETGKPSINFVTDGVHGISIEVWHWEYIIWLENLLNAFLASYESRITPAQEHAYKEEE